MKTNNAIRESYKYLPKTMGSVMTEGKQEEYQEFFKAKLKKWNVDSPAKLSKEDKTKFFNEIKSEWKGVSESYTCIALSRKFLPKTVQRIVEAEATNDYQEFFKEKLKQWNVSSPSELSSEDKKKFFGEIKSEWKSAINESQKFMGAKQKLNESKKLNESSDTCFIIDLDDKEIVESAPQSEINGFWVHKYGNKNTSKHGKGPRYIAVTKDEIMKGNFYIKPGEYAAQVKSKFNQ